MKACACWLLIIIVLLAFLLSGCTWVEGLTGAVTADAATTTVTVESEGVLLADAEIYVNGKYVGKTVSGGSEEKGTKLVVLSEGENIIVAKKQGYITSSIASGAGIENSGLQKPETENITISLERAKAEYEISLKRGDNLITGAQVALYKENEQSPFDILETDEKGKVIFKDLEPGDYRMSISKGEDISAVFQKTIGEDALGGTVTSAITFTAVPKVDEALANISK